MASEGKKQAMSEERTAAASYILTFYQEVQLLTQSYAAYLNILAELQAKYGYEDLAKKVEEAEKQQLVQTVQNIRAYANKVFISYSCIKENLPAKEDEAGKAAAKQNHDSILNAKAKLNSTFIIEATQIETYVIELNRFLVSNVMRNLLVSSSDIVNSIYADS